MLINTLLSIVYIVLVAAIGFTIGYTPYRIIKHFKNKRNRELQQIALLQEQTRLLRSLSEKE